MNWKRLISVGIVITATLNLAGCGGSPGHSKAHSKSEKTEQKGKVASHKIQQKSNQVTVKVKK